MGEMGDMVGIRTRVRVRYDGVTWLGGDMKYTVAIKNYYIGIG